MEQESTYFDPNDSGNKFVVLPKGKYQAYVVEFNLNKEDWLSQKTNQKADIYEATYQLIDSDLEGKTFRTDKGEEIDGSTFFGREVKSKGIFLWKKPGNGDAFEPNPAGNKRVFKFLEAVGYPIKDKTVTNSKGQEIVVKEIPVDIDEKKVVGKPVTIDVMHEEYDGKIYAKELGVHKLEGVEARKEEESDLPF
tara:strand:- start:25104 stop:25685 length:582 start_codon:yes stop_codon:yes gene_type:complete